jgi:hypothetical protein
VYTATGNSNNQNSKLFSLDHLASCAAKALLQQMTASTINWINSGFNGSPAYLTDPEGFLVNTADQFTSDFISPNGPLAGLCSPWSVDVKLTLGLEQANRPSATRPNASRYTCTLGTIIGNAQNASIRGFIGGDFNQGGWSAFISMVTVPQNNPFGSYILAKSDLTASVGSQHSSLSQNLSEGHGFLSWQNCQTVNEQNMQTGQVYSLGVNQGQEQIQQCTTQTPGSVISNALDVHTNSGVVETELSNDINSVVNALISQLTSQMLSKGLGALSSNGSGVNSSAGITALQNNISGLQGSAAAAQNNVVTPTSSTGSFTSQLQGDAAASQTTTSYTAAVNLITTSQNNYQTAVSCLQTVTTGTAQTNVQSQITNLQTQLTNLNTALATVPQGSAAQTNIQTEISGIQAQIATLQAQASAASNITTGQIATAQSDINAINTVLSNQVTPLLVTLTTDQIAAQNNLTSVNSTQAGVDLANAQTQAAQFNQDAQQYLAACKAIIAP